MGSLLIAAALAMLVIYAGIKLLIQEKKETLGGLYRWAAWGFIVAGKLLLVLIAIVCIIMFCRYGMNIHRGKMKHKYGYSGHMDHCKMNKKMMGCSAQEGMHGNCMNGMNCSMMKEHCGGMQGCCNMMDARREENCCANGMMSCGMEKSDTLRRKR